MKKADLITVAVLVPLVCAVYLIWSEPLRLLVSGRQSPERRAPVFEPPGIAGAAMDNHIAYVGNDGHIWVTSADGSKRERLTNVGNDYAIPAWSSDNTRLAFTGSLNGAAALYAVSPATRAAPTLLAQAKDVAPFFFNWAPKGTGLAYLAGSLRRSAMRVVDAADPATNVYMAESMPNYWAWSPHGDALLLHSVRKVHYVAGWHTRERESIDLPPTGCQAPCWSAKGLWYFVVMPNDAPSALIEMDPATREWRTVAETAAPTQIVISPNGEYIASMSIREDFSDGSFRGFRHAETELINVATGESTPVGTSRTRALFWSPDSRYLAILDFTSPLESPEVQYAPESLSLTMADGVSPLRLMTWSVHSMEDATAKSLITFAPSDELLRVVPYFDAYAPGYRFWSPDSSELLVFGLADGGRFGEIWVINVTGSGEPQHLAEGVFGSWSW